MCVRNSAVVAFFHFVEVVVVGCAQLTVSTTGALRKSS